MGLWSHVVQVRAKQGIKLELHTIASLFVPKARPDKGKCLYIDGEKHQLITVRRERESDTKGPQRYLGPRTSVCLSTKIQWLKEQSFRTVVRRLNTHGQHP